VRQQSVLAVADLRLPERGAPTATDDGPRPTYRPEVDGDRTQVVHREIDRRVARTGRKGGVDCAGGHAVHEGGSDSAVDDADRVVQELAGAALELYVAFVDGDDREVERRHHRRVPDLARGQQAHELKTGPALSRFVLFLGVPPAVRTRSVHAAIVAIETALRNADTNVYGEAVTDNVLQLLRERKQQGSTPGHRRDSARLALVIEGGSSRGAYSSGMTVAIEQ
jgi:hypothetical protein